MIRMSALGGGGWKLLARGCRGFLVTGMTVASLSGCVGTETGNPNAEVRVRLVSSDPERLVVSSAAPSADTSAEFWVQQAETSSLNLEFISCEGGSAEASVGDTSLLDSGHLEVPEDTYCAVNVELLAGDGDIGTTMVGVEPGTGRTIRFELDSAGLVNLAAPGGNSWTARRDTAVVLAIDLALLLAPGDVSTIVPEASDASVSRTENAGLQEVMSGRLRTALLLVEDASGTGLVETSDLLNPIMTSN